MAENPSPEAVAAANRLAAQARKAAKDTPLSKDFSGIFDGVVRGGNLTKEIDDAFNYTQLKMTGFLGLVCSALLGLVMCWVRNIFSQT